MGKWTYTGHTELWATEILFFTLYVMCFIIMDIPIANQLKHNLQHETVYPIMIKFIKPLDILYSLFDRIL